MGVLALHEESSGRVTVKLQGTFDGAAAERLRRVLDEIGSDEVVLDFSHVGDFLDLAVALLTRSLTDRKVQVRGLRDHQERLLRCFGWQGQAPRPRAYYTPEEPSPS